MYHTIVRRNIRQAFDHLNQADYTYVVRQFAPNVEHWFAGNHALSGQRCHAATAQQWYARLFRLFPGIRFDVKEIFVSGRPWLELSITRGKPLDDRHHHQLDSIYLGLNYL